ncbi:MAG: ribosome biogenesis GTPase Der [Methylococcaceae bacterium]|nr:MAG: ribosome biogenesis GTPase Der [Methylococcaceae bacterium]
MLPVVALVGRPNVGKSTLFNFLTRSKDALVADFPGLTRDRKYGQARRGERPFLLVDTGGIVDEANGGIDEVAMRQVDLALEEADLVLFLVDAREGLNAADEAIARRLRRIAKPIRLLANKIDGINGTLASAEFHALALGEPLLLAAAHGTGVDQLLHQVEALLPAAPEEPENLVADGIRIAVVGRPNVGKSTLVNRILGEERVVVFDQPGTTRDSIYIPFERNERRYTLIDTAGIRRRSRVDIAVEKFSVIKALQAIDRAHVVVYLIDASEGVTDQDATLLGQVVDAGRALIIGLNKWDGLSSEQRQIVRRQMDLRLGFVEFAERHFISALHGSGVGVLFDRIDDIYAAGNRDLPTPLLTKLMLEAQEAHQPPLVQGRRIKLKYAHQGGSNPPVIIIHGNQTEALAESYRRYLVNFFRTRLRLQGTPLRLEFRSSNNPYKDRPNPLSESQLRKKRRLMRHVKKR